LLSAQLVGEHAGEDASCAVTDGERCHEDKAELNPQMLPDGSQFADDHQAGAGTACIHEPKQIELNRGQHFPGR